MAVSRICVAISMVSPIFLAWYFSSAISALGNVGCGYAAKYICSGVFVANRSVASVAKYDLAPLALYLVAYEVDYERKSVNTTAFLGAFSSVAIYHSQYTGCSVVADMSEYQDTHRGIFDNFSATIRPRGDRLGPDLSREWNFPANPNKDVQNAIDAELTSTAFEQSHTRAIVVVHRGALLAEGYASDHMADVTMTTSHLGWSMTKALLAVLIGMRVHQGHLTLDQPVLRNTSLRRVLQMADILPIREDYGETGDVPRMLFQEPSIINFIESYPEESGRQTRGPGAWYYSSALSNALSHILRQTFPTLEEYWRFPREALFDVIGASSFVMETDQSGLFVCSTFSYATARDWAKLGQLLVTGGRWRNQQLVDKDFVDFMFERAEHSAGIYGGQIWCVPTVPTPEGTPLVVQRERVSVEYLLRASPPLDTCWLAGYEGQFVFVIPSQELVVVRLGKTPGMVAPADPDLWKTWHPAWNVTGFLRSVLNGVGYS